MNSTNNPIRILVIDDDPVGRRLLKALISEHPSLTFLGEADSITSAHEQIVHHRPDAIFLDIHMPDGTGIDLLRDLDFLPFVVFVTLSEQHALAAIDFDPVDYLIKPATPERFAATVARLERRIHAARALARETHPAVSWKIGNETRRVACSEIIALQADGNFSRIFLRNEAPAFVSSALGRHEEFLPSPPFLRLDRSLIVNLDHVVKWHRLSKDEGQLVCRGADAPFDLGRIAMERLRILGKKPPTG